MLDLPAIQIGGSDAQGMQTSTVRTTKALTELTAVVPAFKSLQRSLVVGTQDIPLGSHLKGWLAAQIERNSQRRGAAYNVSIDGLCVESCVSGERVGQPLQDVSSGL